MRGKSGYTYRTYQDFGAKNASFYASDKSHYGNIPDGWREAPMSELFILNPKSKLVDESLCGFIPMSLVEDGFSGRHYFETRNWEQVKKGFSQFQNGDIGIAKISPCFENLKSVIFENLPNGNGAGTTELTIIRSLGVYSKFYLYLFKSGWYISEGTKYFKGVVGQQRVNKEIFTDLIVPLPPLNEQKRIVEEIDRYFALVDVLEQNEYDLKDAVQKAKSKILDLALSGRLTSDTSHYPQLPEGWEEVRLGDISRLISGTSYSKNDIRADGIRILRGGNIQYGKTLLLDNDVYISTSLRNKECSLVRGDIVIVASTGSLDLIGKAGYIEQDIPDAQIGAFLRIVRPIDSSVSQYLRLIFESNLYKSHIQDLAKGTNINNIKASYITDFFIPLPPICEQKAICSMVKVIFQQLDDIESSIVK
uniref:restriction endonuclease subunit S n=1 Tax=Candidatus Cryptobacteroides bacterium TaxID=3085639 RepID=UPI0040257A36